MAVDKDRLLRWIVAILAEHNRREGQGLPIHGVLAKRIECSPFDQDRCKLYDHQGNLTMCVRTQFLVLP